MNTLKNKLKKKHEEMNNPYGLFRNETGAIDLSSIMVGIIVIGLIGGVIAATVFSVIPWTQDNAAKQQLDSIAAAESAYMGLASDTSSTLPAGAIRNAYGNSDLLASAGLLGSGETHCVSTSSNGKTYAGFAQSATGKIWTITSENSKAVIHTGTLPTDCQFITGEYVDPAPMRTSFTYKCNTTVTSGALPFAGTINGTETWSDGLTRNVTGSSSPSRTFTAGVTYTVNFDGTYTMLQGNTSLASMNLSPCLRSVDHLGSQSGVVDSNQGFYNTPNLTSVPEHIPSTLTNMMYMFMGSGINDPTISKWDVSNVTRMSQMFYNASNFNQPLNNWNVSNVTMFDSMFANAAAFNQPLDKWNTSKAIYTSSMFQGATSFNQNISGWNVSKVVYMQQMFYGATAFNQNLSGWNTAVVTSGANFAPNTFPTAYLPPKTTKMP